MSTHSTAHNLAKCFPNPDREKDFYSADGSWICGDGPYRKEVTRACALDPGLHKPDAKTRLNSLDQCRSRVVVLEIDSKGASERRNMGTPEALSHYFNSVKKQADPSPETMGRIYILEGLKPGFVNLLGDHFKLDPSMFKKQERSSVFATEHEWSNDNPTLPSSRCKPYLHLRYLEVLHFGKPLPSLQVSCADTGRHIGVTSFSDKLEPNAAVRRKTTFWSRDRDDGSWDAVILCDPPVVEILDGNATEDKQHIKVQTMPFQGGYVDFIPFDKRQADQDLGPSRVCFLEDFVYYFTTYAPIVKKPGANCASLFVKKLIAAHLLEFTSYIRGLVYYHSWLIAGKDPDFNNDNLAASKQHWGAAQGLSMRCSQYVESLEADRMELQSSLDADERQLCAGSNWTNYEADYDYVYKRLKDVQRRADALTSSLGALSSLAAGRQAQNDGQRGQLLTVIGMIFIPLAYVAGLFSMSDGYRPGGDLFWVYWVVAVPCVVVLLLATFLLNYIDFFSQPISQSFRRLVKRLTPAMRATSPKSSPAMAEMQPEPAVQVNEAIVIQSKA